MGEKAIHVRVAEALGCTPIYSTDPKLAETQGPACWCGVVGLNGIPHGKGAHTAPRGLNEVARYDADWSATGPLIEKYGISIEFEDPGWRAERDAYLPPRPIDTAMGYAGRWGQLDAYGETPLAAVCNLILVLAESGELQ